MMTRMTNAAVCGEHTQAAVRYGCISSTVHKSCQQSIKYMYMYVSGMYWSKYRSTISNETQHFCDNTTSPL